MLPAPELIPSIRRRSGSFSRDNQDGEWTRLEVLKVLKVLNFPRNRGGGMFGEEPSTSTRHSLRWVASPVRYGEENQPVQLEGFKRSMP